MLLNTVNICHSYCFNKTLIGPWLGRKHRQGNHTKKILEKGKAQNAVATQMQRKPDKNAALSKIASFIAKHS